MAVVHREVRKEQIRFSEFTKTNQKSLFLPLFRNLEQKKKSTNNIYIYIFTYICIESVEVLQLIFNMQAVRQCSVCAGRVAGGHLWSQVNVSGLQKSVLRKGACVRFQRYVRNNVDIQLCRKSVALTLLCILSRLSYSRSESVLVGSRMSAFGDRTDGPNRRRVTSGPQDFPWTQV